MTLEIRVTSSGPYRAGPKTAYTYTVTEDSADGCEKGGKKGYGGGDRAGLRSRRTRIRGRLVSVRSWRRCR
ncbi:hypothetical protein ACFVWY_00535 [Streptomyces sp. NPDC058195]|uniref:hypothetical protein n=1 Tax=Streptomyces sp. NPDC058195 TaxID=3346375 RepID=UPI0036EF6DE3